MRFQRDTEKILVKWGLQHYRDYPWRYENSLYRISVSEILLRRTGADMVKAVYSDLINKYPDPEALGNICPTDIKSLGLQKRIKILKDFSSTVITRYGGTIPHERSELINFYGFGDYTVSAIRVFGLHFREPLIDANTVRIISRVAGKHYSDSTRRQREIHMLYSEFNRHEDPVIFGYSILDFGALICTPVPHCNICPLYNICLYNEKP
ncbi:MAG: hypothetical protein M1317_00675 [Candidatus Thermoplasmatota archaeon]|nr:hypothetical protein [Candidatus Thermoplasmatota archaeon]